MLRIPELVKRSFQRLVKSEAAFEQPTVVLAILDSIGPPAAIAASCRIWHGQDCQAGAGCLFADRATCIVRYHFGQAPSCSSDPDRKSVQERASQLPAALTSAVFIDITFAVEVCMADKGLLIRCEAGAKKFPPARRRSSDQSSPNIPPPNPATHWSDGHSEIRQTPRWRQGTKLCQQGFHERHSIRVRSKFLMSQGQVCGHSVKIEIDPKPNWRFGPNRPDPD